MVKASPLVRAATIPSACDTVVFGHEIADNTKVEIGERFTKFRHKRHHGNSPPQLMRLGSKPYVGRPQLMNNSGIPGESPKLSKPSNNNRVVGTSHGLCHSSFATHRAKTERLPGVLHRLVNRQTMQESTDHLFA